MNIALFSKQLPSDAPNGVSVQVHRLANALVTLGHSLSVFSFSPPPANAAYRTVTFPPKTASTITRKFSAAVQFATVNTSPFDILHYHGDDYLCRGSARRVRTFYGSALREALHARTPGRFAYQSLFYLFELVSCSRKGTLTAISDDTRRYLPRIQETIACGVNNDIYTPSGKKTPWPSVLFLGDFNSRKRGASLLDAFTKVIRPQFPDARLSVVGPVPCNGSGIDYLGRISEDALIAAYQKNWVFCMPSSYEGFGVPLIEAMSCGTAVVATTNPGSRALIRHNVNGMLCSEEALGAVLSDVLGSAPLRAALTAEGLRTAGQYSIATTAQRYNALYQTIASRIKKTV